MGETRSGSTPQAREPGPQGGAPMDGCTNLSEGGLMTEIAKKHPALEVHRQMADNGFRSVYIGRDLSTPPKPGTVVIYKLDDPPEIGDPE